MKESQRFRLYDQSDKAVDMFLKVFFPFISLSNIILDLGSSFPIYGSHMAVTNTTCMCCANWKLRSCYYIFFHLVRSSRSEFNSCSLSLPAKGGAQMGTSFLLSISLFNFLRQLWYRSNYQARDRNYLVIWGKSFLHMELQLQLMGSNQIILSALYLCKRRVCLHLLRIQTWKIILTFVDKNATMTTDEDIGIS